MTKHYTKIEVKNYAPERHRMSKTITI